MKSASVSLLASLICGLIAVSGCGGNETSAPGVQPASAEVTVQTTKEEATGTVKFESVFKDPKTMVAIDGSEYRLAELDKDMKLRAGGHRVEVKLGPRLMQRLEFTLSEGQRLIVELYDPERRAAEWAHQLGGVVSVTDDLGRRTKVSKDQTLSGENFHVNAISLRGITGVTLEGLKNLHGLQAITELDLGDTYIEDAGVEQLKDLTGLKTLNLRHARLSDDGLAHLKNLKELDQLILQHIPARGAGFVHLHDLPITSLNLGASAIDDAGLRNLLGFKKLKVLSLFDTSITSDGLTQLKGLNVESLHLGHTSISGPNLSALKEIHGLKELSFFNGASIKDADLQHLRELTGLTELDLSGTKVTEEGVRQLQQSLPNTKVLH